MVKRLIVGDSEQEVAVVCSSPAGGLEGPIQVREGDSSLGELTACRCVDTISEFRQ